MLVNANIPIRFKQIELQYFNWMYNVAPCFPVNSSKINIISDPRKFYETLCERFQTAERRISVASLYIGTGSLERKLLEYGKINVMKNKLLKFHMLLDYQRGTRGEVNSVTLLRDFVINNQCRVCLYQTPKLFGSWSKALPSRYNELIGLQHMKLYITDDSVLISGANCSNDYFGQRQDRYVEINDEDLANFYNELIDEVSSCSKQCTKEGIKSQEYSSKESLIQEISGKISDLIEKWKDKQLTKMMSIQNNSDTSIDTWVFPLLQMGEFNFKQDEQVTNTLLESVPKDSCVKLATGYFNLTDNYAKTLLNICKANISLLMAHPNANGFLGAKGPAGGIPHAYSLIARMFWQRVVDSNQSERIQMLEYERPGWTFHAKGLWYYPPGSGVPWATVIGSANLGERSVRRDLEAQAVIFTVSSDLQNFEDVSVFTGHTEFFVKRYLTNNITRIRHLFIWYKVKIYIRSDGERLHEECSKLHEHASECSNELQKRETPMWVKATVGLFRTYF